MEDIIIPIKSNFDSTGFDDVIASAENVKRTIENSFKQFKLPDPSVQIKNFISKFNEQWKLADPASKISDSLKQFNIADPSGNLNKMAVMQQQNLADISKDTLETEKVMADARTKIAKRVQTIQDNLIKKQEQSIKNFMGGLNKLKFSLLGIGFSFQQVGQLAKGLFQPLDNFMGISYEMARQVGGDLYNSLLSVTALFNEFAMTLLEAAAPAIEWAIGLFAQLFAWFENLGPSAKTLIGWIIGLSVALAPIIGIVGFLAMGIINIITLFGMVGAPVLAFIGVIAQLIAIILIVYSTNKEFIDSVISLWNSVSAYIGVYIGNIILFFNNLVTFFNNTFKIAWWAITEVIKAVFAAIGIDFDVFSTAITNVWTTLWEALKMILGGAWGWIVDTIKNSYNWIIGILNSLIETYNILAEKAGGTKLGLFSEMPTTSVPNSATQSSSSSSSSTGRPNFNNSNSGQSSTTNNYYYTATDNVSKQALSNPFQ